MPCRRPCLAFTWRVPLPRPHRPPCHCRPADRLATTGCQLVGIRSTAKREREHGQTDRQADTKQGSSFCTALDWPSQLVRCGTAQHPSLTGDLLDKQQWSIMAASALQLTTCSRRTPTHASLGSVGVCAWLLTLHHRSPACPVRPLSPQPTFPGYVVLCLLYGTVRVLVLPSLVGYAYWLCKMHTGLIRCIVPPSMLTTPRCLSHEP